MQEVMQVAVEGLLDSSFSLQSRCVHTEDSGKLVVLDWESSGQYARDISLEPFSLRQPPTSN